MKYRLLMDVTKTLKTSENCFEDHIGDLKFKFHFCAANQSIVTGVQYFQSYNLIFSHLLTLWLGYLKRMLDAGSIINAFVSLPSRYSIVLRFSHKDSGSQDMLGFSEKTLCIF